MTNCDSKCSVQAVLWQNDGNIYSIRKSRTTMIYFWWCTAPKLCQEIDLMIFFTSGWVLKTIAPICTLSRIIYSESNFLLQLGVQAIN